MKRPLPLSRVIDLRDRRMIVLVCVGLSGLVGAVIRVAIALSDHLWLDELHTAWATGGGLDQVALRASEGNQTPLFFWLIWFIRASLESVPTLDEGLLLRSVSLLAGCGLCPLVAWIVWRWTNSALAVIASAWLAAVDPGLIFYSTEARPYALMQCFGLIQLVCFSNWLSRYRQSSAGATPGSIWHYSDLGLVASTVAMIATQVTSLWLPMVEVCFLLGVSSFDCLQGHQRYSVVKLWPSAAILAVLSLILNLPVLMELNAILQQRENWQLISDRHGLVAEMGLALRWGILMPLLGIGIVSLSERRKPSRESSSKYDYESRDRISEKLWLVGMGATMPCLGLWLLDYLQVAPAANSRYAQVGTVAFPIFAALAIGWMMQVWQRLALTTSVLLSSLILNPWLLPWATSGEIPRLRWEDWGSPITEINRSSLETRRPVMLFSNLIEDRHAVTNDRQDFQAYLRFPLWAVPQLVLEQDDILVYPSIEFSGLAAADVQRVRQSLGVWVIIRAREPLVSEVITAVARQLNEEEGRLNKSDWQIESAHFDQSPWSDVKLFLIWQPIPNAD